MDHIKTIEELNDALSKTHSNYDIKEYIRKVNNLHDKPIDLSFMEELLEYIERKECCIPHILLVKYGVISGNNSNMISSNTNRLLEQYEFIEGYSC